MTTPHADEPGFVEGWLARLTHTEGIAAIQVLEIATGALVVPRGQPTAESAEEARARSVAVVRSLGAGAGETDGAAAFEAVPPAWRGRLHGGDHALYQARVGSERILEALVSQEGQDVADLLDATVERLEDHYRRPGPG
ncbi:MAG TPA: hypothetical protein VMR21_10150 [Vicinamibacteria bacterium]|nr:hypothetical protein [Vicinamibacteria bacterium]